MNYLDVPGGTVHKLPKALLLLLQRNENALLNWKNITPLARNEWICWAISPKLQKTRDLHLSRIIIELNQGKKRPCCWMGCIHRQDKELSSSVKWIINRS